MNEARLRQLVEKLRAPLPPGFRWSYIDILDVDYLDNDFEQPPCGTCGCALGVAALTMPDFCAVAVPGDGPIEWRKFDLEAAREFFGLDNEAFNYIFFARQRPSSAVLYLREPPYKGRSHSTDIQPDDVAALIERLMAEDVL